MSRQPIPDAKVNLSAKTRLDEAQYAAMFKQLDKEALYTMIAAIFITLAFWLTIFLSADSDVSLLHMPLWFVISCLGGYVLSVIVVIALVKLGMKNLPLHPDVNDANKDKVCSGIKERV